MAVIQLEIDETLIHAVGASAVKTFIERQLSLLRLKHLGERISEAIQQADVDHGAEVEGARQEAWQELRGKYLKDVS